MALSAGDWGDEVMSDIYIREGNPLRGILGKTARYLADGSCPIGEHTWQSAYWSAQSAGAAAYAVIEGDRSAYALCRPPGRHARAEAAGGFCFLNNAAIAAQVLGVRSSKLPCSIPICTTGKAYRRFSTIGMTWRTCRSMAIRPTSTRWSPVLTTKPEWVPVRPTT